MKKPALQNSSPQSASAAEGFFRSGTNRFVHPIAGIALTDTFEFDPLDREVLANQQV
jgi:hypothetical protein